MELVDSEFKGFEKRREEIIAHMTELDAKVINVQQEKLNEKSAVQSFQEVKNRIREDRTFTEGVRNDLSTLENYVERYLPLSTLKVLMKLI